MTLPVIAIVGRPNVGKSTFVNRIAQVNDAIVHESRGVTRDRSYHEADWNGRDFMLIDTGGVEMGEGDRFQKSIKAQVMMATEEADLIVFLTDGTCGITPDDEEVARLLKRAKRPIFLCVNKMDDPGKEDAIWEFCNLGLGDPWPVSAVHGNGTGDLLDALVAALPPALEEDPRPDETCIAVIGRPNAGKSSLTNKLLGRDRSIVSEVAGTTRDAVDTLLERNGKNYRIVDTAGIRRKSQIDEDVEYYGFVRALRAIDRCDVALLIIDSTLGLTDQDQRVAGLAQERGCGLIVLLNKWDIMDDPDARDNLIDMITDRLMFVGYAPVLRISALTGRSVDKIWDIVDTAAENASRKIPTNKLNALLAELKDFGHTVVKGSKRLKLSYVSQTGVKPPTFTFFANVPEIIDDSFERYLENRLRDKFDLVGTPIRIRFKRKG